MLNLAIKTQAPHYRPVNLFPSLPSSSLSSPLSLSSSSANIVSASKLLRCNGLGFVGIGAGKGEASRLKSLSRCCALRLA